MWREKTVENKIKYQAKREDQQMRVPNCVAWFKLNRFKAMDMYGPCTWIDLRQWIYTDHVHVAGRKCIGSRWLTRTLGTFPRRQEWHVPDSQKTCRERRVCLEQRAVAPVMIWQRRHRKPNISLISIEHDHIRTLMAKRTTLYYWILTWRNFFRNSLILL